MPCFLLSRAHCSLAASRGRRLLMHSLIGAWVGRLETLGVTNNKTASARRHTTPTIAPDLGTEADGLSLGFILMAHTIYPIRLRSSIFFSAPARKNIRPARARRARGYRRLAAGPACLLRRARCIGN